VPGFQKAIADAGPAADARLPVLGGRQAVVLDDVIYYDVTWLWCRDEPKLLSDVRLGGKFWRESIRLAGLSEILAALRSSSCGHGVGLARGKEAPVASL